MKNLFVVIILGLVVCFSCDGRKTKKEFLEEAVSAFNLKVMPVRSITYDPESYVEIVTDTLIAGSLNVRIKNYSLLDEQILISEDINDISKTQMYQRIFESEISISTASKTIFSTHVSAKTFKKDNADVFWDHATLQHAWVNQELSTAKTIELDMGFINPKNKAYKLYRMSVDTNGHQLLNLIEERG